MVDYSTKVYKTKIGKSLLIKTIVIGIVFLIGLVLISTLSSHISNRIYKENQEIEDIKSQIHLLLQALTDQETGQRGYNLTGDQRFLEPYYKGTETYIRLGNQISVQVKHHPELVKPINQMIESGYYWHDYFGATQVELQRNGDNITASSLLEGMHQFAQFRQNVQAALVQAKKDEARNFHQLDVLNLQMNISLVSLSILLFLVLIVMILQVFKQISEPILEVRKAMKEMANGNFDYPLPQPSKRRDELTELVASLKLMRFRLERTLNYSRQLAERDGLTGVYNRRILDMTLVERVMAYQKNGMLFSLILLDIDHFKGYNDNYGHSEGDRILKHMATLVSKSISDTDLFARYGGEEFTILTNNEQPEQLAEHLRRVIEENPLDAYQLTASFGVTQVREGDGPKDLLDRADEALYRAKSAGRNRVEVKV